MRFLTNSLAALVMTISNAVPAIALEEQSVEADFTPWRITATDHLLVTNRKDVDDVTLPPQNTFMNEANLRGEYGDYNLGALIANRFNPQGDLSNNRPFVLEKKNLGFESNRWHVQLGDSHQEFGRGIALALYRNDVFGSDNTLEGASVRFNPTGLDTTAFAGRVRSLHAPVAVNPFQNPIVDRDVYMAGGSAKVKVATDTTLGGHALVAYNRPFALNEFDRRWNAFGATVQSDAILPGVDAYAEANVLMMQRLDAATDRLPNGYGNFAGVTYGANPWKVKVEFKDYRDYNFDFRRPPTLEDDIVQTVNTQDVTATRFYGERRFGDGNRNSVYSSYLIGTDRVVHSDLHHAVVGTKVRGPDRIDVEAKAGYRWFPGQSQLSHGLLKAHLPTAKGQAVEVGYRKQRNLTNLNFLPTLDDRNYFDFTYVFNERWTLNLGYEYVPTNTTDPGQHFYNAGATTKIGSLLGRAFVGQTSGGVVCSGGVCRQVPPYTGGLVEGTYVF